LQRRDFIKTLAAVCTSPVATFWSLAARAQDASVSAGAAAAADGIGQVSTVQGGATVTRGNPGKVAALRVNDPIFEHDTLVTGPNSALGITFDDQTTFSLSADTRIVVDAFVYQQGGAGNAAKFNVAIGTAAFVASLVAKTGDMKISTPSATLGIRGTTGVVEVPAAGAAGAAAEPKIKLYADADGHVGQIEVFDRQGGRLGTLNRSASAFTIARGPGGGFRAVPFQIPPGEAARDRGVLQRLRSSHAIGQRMTTERMRTRGSIRPGTNPRSPGRTPEHRGGSPNQGGQRMPGGASPSHGGSPHPTATPRAVGPPRGGGAPRGGGGGGRKRR
jgi:FecR protein